MGASPRQLAYRDRFVWELEQVVSSIFDDCNGLTNRYVFPDMSTRVPLVLYLSQTEFTTLYSAVLTGADLTYPNSSHDVENLFLQMVTCDMSQLCAALADCILNDLLVQQALNTWAADNSTFSGAGNVERPLDDATLQEDLLDPAQACDNDHIFGMCYALVDAIHDATSEVLEGIEILTNPVEIIAELGDNFPGAGMLLSGVDVAAYMQNTAAESYALAWSSITRDELACIFFCIMKDDCTLSFERIFDTYLITSGATPPVGETLEEWLLWLIALALPSNLITVATISLLGLLAMRHGGIFGPIVLGIRSLETIFAIAKDDTDSNWDILCTACPAVATPIILNSCGSMVAGGTLQSLGGVRWRITATERVGVDWRASIERDGGECFTLSNVTDGRTGVQFHAWETCLLVCDLGFTHPSYGSQWKGFMWTSDGPFVMDFDFNVP